jgi:hypothetical protein
MRIRMIFLVIGALLIPMLAMGQGPAKPAASFHEEISQAWNELGRHFGQIGDRWREHFASGETREERPLISFILRHRDQLGLSSEQVQGLEGLRNDFQREMIRSEADLRIAEMDLSSLLSADPVDLQKVEAKVREAERLKADLRFGRIRTIEKGKALLTKEQRAKLSSLMAGPRYSRLQSKD